MKLKQKLRKIINLLSAPNPDEKDLVNKINITLNKDRGFKKENILIPQLNDNLNLYDFISIAEASDEIGYNLITYQLTV